MLPVIIDIVLIVILVFSIWRGISKGLILSVVGLFAMIIVFFGARFVADNYSDQVQQVIAPLISSTVNEATTEERVKNELEYETEDEATLTQAAENIFGRLGIYENATDRMVQGAIDGAKSELVTFKDAVANQFEGTLAYMLVFILAYLLLNIIVSVIINLCNVVFKLPGLNVINAIGGAVAGLIMGLLVVFAIAWAVRYLGFMSKQEIISNTSVLEFFVKNNPFNNLLSV